MFSVILPDWDLNITYVSRLLRDITSVLIRNMTWEKAVTKFLYIYLLTLQCSAGQVFVLP